MLAPDVARTIQLAQFNGWMKVSAANVPAGVIVATMLYGMLWEQMGDPWLRGGYCGILASYAVLFATWRSWTRRSDGAWDVGARMRRLLAIRFVLCSCWAFAIVTMAAVSDPVERSVIYAVAVALMSTTVFGEGPAVFALSGWLPATAGAFGMLFATGSLIGIGPLVCLAAYSGLTLLAILAVDRQTIERGLNTIRLERHAETINILLRDFEESSSDWLWETDAALMLRHVSSRFAEVAMREIPELEINLLGLLGSAPDVPARDHAIVALQQRIDARTSFRELVVPVQFGEERRWWALTGKPLFDSHGTFLGYRGVGSDVTATHRVRERIAYLARHDPLTDLANRTGFNDAIAAAAADCRRQRSALLCLDLDEFKTINDSYGHDVGDAVLRTVAQRLRGVLREHDFAARLGGDEFAILLAVSEREEAVAVAERVVAALRPALEWNDLVIRVGVSVGIALVPDDADDADNLYRNADLALYRAKSAGGGAWRLYDLDMDQQLHERRLLQRDLREALPNGQLYVAYQPFVDLRTRELLGVEALVRWRHPERGVIPPSEFIPFAERGGLIGEIGGFVLAEAAALASRLAPPLAVAVNLSPLQLSEPGLLAMVDEVLERVGLPPERMEFEITESVMLETSGRSLENLHGLRSRGHRIAIDDFGTGYSSLAVLRNFPFDRLKIDRSFIADMEREDGEGPIVRAVIGLARALGISVTAEGVETERQARLLCMYRCTGGQGYYFARPLSPGQVLALAAKPEGGVARPRVKLPTRLHLRADEPAEALAAASRAPDAPASPLAATVGL